MLVSCHFRFQNSVHNGQSMQHYVINVWTRRRTARAQASVWDWANNVQTVCASLYHLLSICILALCNTFVNPNLFELTHLRILRGTESEDESAWNEAVEAHEANTNQLWPTIMCRRLFTYFIINLDYQHIRTNVLLKAHQYDGLK